MSGKNSKGDSAKLDMSKGDAKATTADPSGKDAQATKGEEFLRDQVGGRSDTGGGMPNDGQIQDHFGQQTAGNDPAVDDLLNPDMPTKGGGLGDSRGPATWEDGPTDQSVGVSDGVSVADGMTSGYIENTAKGIGYIADALGGGDDAPASQPAGSEDAPAGQPGGSADTPAGQTIDHVDETDLGDFLEGDGDGFYTEGQAGGVEDVGSQTMAPGSTGGALVQSSDGASQSSETISVTDDTGETTEVNVNRQSSEESVHYSFDENGEYWATDSNGNRFPVNAEDVPPGTRVTDESGAFGGEGSYTTPPAKKPDTDDDGSDGADANGDDGSGDDASGDDGSGDDASGDDSSGDGDGSDTDDGSDSDGSETPDYDSYVDPGVVRAREAGRQVEAEAGQESDGSEAWGKHNDFGNDIDPVEHESVDTTGGSQPTSDSGISNPEGAENFGGARTEPHGQRNEPDYGQDSGVVYDGEERAPSDELPTMNQTLDPGMVLGHDQEQTTLDADDLRDGLVDFEAEMPADTAEDDSKFPELAPEIEPEFAAKGFEEQAKVDDSATDVYQKDDGDGAYEEAESGYAELATPDFADMSDLRDSDEALSDGIVDDEILDI